MRCAILLGLFLTALVTPILHGDTFIYTYNGPDLATIYNYDASGDILQYSSSDYVTAVLTLSVPIISNGVLTDFGPGGLNDVISFSLSDGLQTLNFQNTQSWLFWFETSGGAITEWWVRAASFVGFFPYGTAEDLIGTEFGYDGDWVSDFAEISSPAGLYWNQAQTPLFTDYGTLPQWSESPEPSALGMLITGAIVIVMAAAYRRRRQSKRPADRLPLIAPTTL